MPTVCASVPMHPPITTSRRRRVCLTAALTSFGVSSG